MECYEEGDAIHGARIYAEARKIHGPIVIVKSHRHKAQSIRLTENAEAVIVQKLRWIPDR
ncbi:MAG TPA: hypothetical protein VN455_14240 [Methanotrichaceae archaeon]|nr:hypothetical protein [Methanotrichaceae archaeon]